MPIRHLRPAVVLLALAATGIALASDVPPFLPFKPDAFQPVPAASAALRAMADWLRAAPGRRVVIAGEMRRQSPEYALALGQQRAEAVARRLRALGVAAGQIETVSHGRTGRDGVTLQRLEPPPVSSARP